MASHQSKPPGGSGSLDLDEDAVAAEDDLGGTFRSGQDMDDSMAAMQPPLAESTMLSKGTLNLVPEGDEDTFEYSGGEGEDDDDDEEEDDTIMEEEDEEDDEEEDEDDDEDDDDEDDDSCKVEEVTLSDEDADDPLAAASDSSKDATSATPTPKVPPITLPILKLRVAAEDSGGTPSSPASSTGGGHLPAPKRRGRPTKAEMQRREKERQERLNRGELEEPTPRRRGRKPMPPEEKARIKEEKKRQKKAERDEKRKEKRRMKRRQKDGGGGKGEVIKRRGRRARVLTDEEKEAKEELRKQKYEEFKRMKLEKVAKKAERNQALREHRKKKKEEEKKQREAYDKRMQELKASFLDENSHLSNPATGGAQATPGGATAATPGAANEELDETSQSSWNGSRSRYPFEMSQLAAVRQVTAETLFEYRWPLEGKNSEHYFLQEQVCEYLGLKSFKRRYPDLQRRNVEVEERDFLVEMRVVNETQADLGLTALPSSLVLDIMSNDFYEKYDAYMAVVMERKDKVMRQTNYNTVTVEKHKYADFVEKSVRSAAAWNKKLNQEKREKRRAYFDMQTFSIHHPIREKGKMRVLAKPKLGHYPIALIPGQFVDYYKAYTPQQLAYLPLNSTLKGPPQGGTRLVDIVESESEDSDSDSTSSSDSSSGDDSSSGSEDDSDTNSRQEQPVKKKEPLPPKRPIDAEIPGAKCKICNGDRLRNKLGQPEKLLHCSKCEHSAHPQCIGLSLELLDFVTNYNWECTECKVCSKCQDHADEDKMLFCDLCDRGYHNYCVGLNTIPVGRWHCVECTFCISCKARDPMGSEGTAQKWILEYKTGITGNKIYSHTMCAPCHKSWKRGQFCPECSVVFGREANATADTEVEYANCWVCSRQHHLGCVGQATFICSACQRRTMEKTIGAGNSSAHLSGGMNSSSGMGGGGGGGPGFTRSRRSAVAN